MNKLSEMVPEVKKLTTSTLQNTTQQMKPESENERINKTINHLLISSDLPSVIHQIKSRWPGKTAKENWDDERTITGWVMAMAESQLTFDRQTLKKALSKWRGIYPPDIYDLLKIIRTPFSDDEILVSLLKMVKARNAIPLPDYSSLTRHELWCLGEITKHGGYADFNNLNRNEQIERWSSLMAKSIKIPETDLPPLFQKPAPALNSPPNEREIRMEKARLAMENGGFTAAMREALRNQISRI